MAADTGNGTTVAFTTSTFTASIVSIQIGERTIEALDVSHLLTSGDRELIPGDLITNAPWTLNFIADVTASSKFTLEPGTVDTLTITLPEQIEAGDPPTIAATGIVLSCKWPDLENDAVQMGSIQFQPNGGTGPTFTQDAGS